FHAELRDRKDFSSTNGTFSVSLNEADNLSIQVSAHDYAEQVQTISETTNDTVNMVFNMKSNPDLRGIVVTPDGQPVAGANVDIVQTSTWSISVGANGKIKDHNSISKLVVTDESGKFQIPSPAEDGLVIAAKEEGFAS